MNYEIQSDNMSNAASDTSDQVHFFSCKHCGGVKEQHTRYDNGFHIVTYLKQIIPTHTSCYHRSWDEERGWNFVAVSPEKVDG